MSLPRLLKITKAPWSDDQGSEGHNDCLAYNIGLLAVEPLAALTRGPLDF